MSSLYYYCYCYYYYYKHYTDIYLKRKCYLPLEVKVMFLEKLNFFKDKSGNLLLSDEINSFSIIN